MTQYMHPFGTTWAAAARRPGTFFGAGASGMTVEGFSVLSYFRFFEQLAALSGIVVQTVILMGIIVTLLRRWKLPVGVVTVLMTLNAALTTLMRDRFLDTGPVPLIVVAALAGLTADLLAARLQLSPSRLSGLRLYAFLVPVILYTLYFLALWVDGGTWWRVHVWSGAIIIAGISGWLLSYLVVPPLKETTG